VLVGHLPAARGTDSIGDSTMKQSPAIRLAIGLCLSLTAFGCAQIAGLTGDYHVEVGGGAGASSMATVCHPTNTDITV